MIISVSYPLTRASPLYPGTPEIIINSFKSIKNGGSTNSSNLLFNSHSGTHIDVPFHFCANGMTVRDCFSLNNSFFPAYCIDIPVKDCIEITPDELERKILTMPDVVALFIRTGWWEKRISDAIGYCNNHPWISPDVPEFLRENCPDLRLFGIDQISISSLAHRDVGRECHRRFLCSTAPILLIEDVNLSDVRLITRKYMLHLFPYFIDDLDGIPVIAIMEGRNRRSKDDPEHS